MVQKIAGSSPVSHPYRVQIVWYIRTMPYKDPAKQKAACHASYLRNKERVRDGAKNRTDTKRQLLRDIKETSGCVDCKVGYPYYVLQFDHKPEFEKSGTLASMVATSSVAQLLAEVEKCDVVCANCHAERTHKRRKHASFV